MSYETLRNDLSVRLLESFTPDQVREILASMDVISADYEITRKSRELILVGGVPEIVKIYIASKAIENRSMRTLESYRRILSNFFAAVAIPFPNISANDIRAYLYSYKQTHNVNDATLNIMRSVICGFFAWATNEEYIARNPAARIGVISHQPADRHAMTPMELETMRSVCSDLREKALVDLLYSTGCRVSEVADMKISDVDMDAGSAVVRHGKGDKRRTVYLNAECIVSLRAYLAARTDSCQALFISDRKPAHALTSRSIESAISKIRDRSGITVHITPHVFRHTTATTALRSGMPVEQVQRLLGHSNINTTLIYAKTDDSDVKANHQRFVS